MNRLKRKPYLFGIAAVALLVVLAVVQFARPSSAESPRLERYMPSETVGFVQVNDLRAQALKIMESEAWREFTKENQAASSLFMMGANHTGALDASYAVGLLGLGADEGGEREPRFVVVAEFDDTDARRTFQNRVMRMVRESSGKDELGLKEEEYNGATLNTVSPGGRRGFTYARVGNTLVFSGAAEAVKRVLDVNAGKKPSLEANETFARARSRMKYSDGMFGFLDGEALERVIDGAPAEAGKGLAAFRQLFDGVGARGVQSVAFTSAFDEGRVVERFAVAAPEKQGVLGTIASNAPTSQELLALVPEDAVQALDVSIANAPQAFEELFALVNQITAQTGNKGPAEALAQFTEKTGVDLRGDILRALGREACIAQLPSGDKRGGVVILNVSDPQGFTRALEKFAERHKRAVTEREYKGVAVRSVAGEQGHGIEYAFVGGNFVSSGEAGMVERVIDTAQGGRSLRASEAYRSASASLSGQPQFVYYNSNAEYLNRLGGILRHGDGEAFKTEGARANLRPSFAFGLSQPEGFYVESRTPLGTFPRLLAALSSKLVSEPKAKEKGSE